MKKNLLKAFVFILLAGFFHACNEPLIEETTIVDPALKSAQSTKITYIVVLEDAELNDELTNIKGYEMRQQAAKRAAEKVMNRAAVADGELGFVYSAALKGFSIKIPPGQVKKLEMDPSVAYIEQNQIVILIEPQEISVNELNAQYTDNVPWGIQRIGGGLSNYTGGGAAWIIDTGIDLDHPDLNVDESNGFSAFTFGRDKDPDDKNGHGTHVAGTVAAKINDIGVVGVAPGATVIPVKVLDARGSGSYDGVIAGVDHVAANGKSGDVANMSLGGPASKALDDAVITASNKGIKFALAAGNDNDDANNYSPARANNNNIYTISAMDSKDNFATFSNYGNPPVDFCEPGVSILSTYKDGGYATASGTSMAAPHMAGILLWGLPAQGGTVNNDPDVNSDGYSDPIGVVGNDGGGGSSNNNPTAVINGTYTGTEDVEITYDASGSSDEDNDPLTFTWNFGDGTISTTTNSIISHTYLWGGSFTVSLTVDDGNGGTDTKTTTTTITEVNDKPVAVPGGPYSSVSGQETLFDASGSYDYDNMDGTNENDQILTYNWNFGDESTIATTTSSTSHTYNSIGEFTVTLTVSDGTDNSDPVTTTATITEVSASVAPAIDVFDPVNTSNPAWTRISVNWSVSDTDGNLQLVKITLFDSGGEIFDTVNTAVSGFNASGTSDLGKKGRFPGSYNVQIDVIDVAENSTIETKTITL